MKKAIGKFLTKEKIDEAKSFLVALIIILIVRSVLIEPFRVPSGSMIPNILIGDFILTDKRYLGWKVPFIEWFTDPIYLQGPKYPKRGDIIVFKYPLDESMNYVKRVIGLPGDKIEIVGKDVYVNGNRVRQREINGDKIMEDMDDKFKRRNFTFYRGKVGDTEFTYQVDTNRFSYYDGMVKIVPKDKFFMMGDNFDWSGDSREWGFVPFKNMKGRVLFVWLSVIFPFVDSENSAKFRFHRIGQTIR